MADQEGDIGRIGFGDVDEIGGGLLGTDLNGGGNEGFNNFFGEIS